VKNPEPIRRTAEIEEFTNRNFIHPMASRLVPLFARMRITPNAVSISGMLLGILAGFAYYRYQDLRFAITGFILMIAWHVLDGADGQLARLTHSQSHFGKVLDGICDHVTFLAVYTSLAIALSHRLGDGVYALVVAAGVCHAVQSATYEVQRQEYDFWGWERKSAESSQPGGLASHDARAPIMRRLFDFLQQLFYGGLSFPGAYVTRKFRTAMTAALDRQPERAALVRQRYREAFAPLVRRWSLLSANYRSLGIFIGALLEAPEYYFWFEIVGFSTILGLLIYLQSVRSRTFFDTLDTANVTSP
jgi:phosphatidylglycerophosphate synthase